MEKRPYNPYNDKTLHLTETQTQSTNPEERAPFNEVIKHRDIVQGFQIPKRLDQYPKWYQNPRRIYAMISVLVFAAFIVYQIVQIAISIASGG